MMLSNSSATLQHQQQRILLLTTSNSISSTTANKTNCYYCHLLRIRRAATTAVSTCFRQPCYLTNRMIHYRQTYAQIQRRRHPLRHEFNPTTQQQMRTYLYLPTSWKEFELRWIRSGLDREGSVQIQYSRIQDYVRNMKYYYAQRKLQHQNTLYNSVQRMRNNSATRKRVRRIAFNRFKRRVIQRLQQQQPTAGDNSFFTLTDNSSNHCDKTMIVHNRPQEQKLQVNIETVNSYLSSVFQRRRKLYQRPRLRFSKNVRKLSQDFFHRLPLLQEDTSTTLIDNTKLSTTPAPSTQFRQRFRNSYQRTRAKIVDRLRNLQHDRFQYWTRRLQQSSVQHVPLTEHYDRSWFDSDTNRPMVSCDATGRYVNPWMSESTGGVKSAFEIVQWRWARTKRLWDELSTYILYDEGKTAKSMMNRRKKQQCSIAASDEISAPTSTKAIYKQLCSTTQTSLSSREDGTMKLTWIGHSTCLLEKTNNTTTKPGSNSTSSTIRILTDPIFSQRSSPFESVVGVARDVPPAILIEDIGPIDVCLISHDHYDHLDRSSVLKLRDTVQMWVVPLGIKKWLLDTTRYTIPADRIVELGWWESAYLVRQHDRRWTVRARHTAVGKNVKKHGSSTTSTPNASIEHPAFSAIPPSPAINDANDSGGNNTMWVTCCPAQHWSSRTFFDRNYRLWCSFAVLFPTSNTEPAPTDVTSTAPQRHEQHCTKFFFGGDTALPESFPLFKMIWDYIGSVDLAALPIGAYEPEFFMRDSHMNPEEAVQVHQDLHAKHSVGIHWGTFALSEEHADDPPKRLHAAAKRVDANFSTVPHGGSVTIQIDNNYNK